MSREILFRGKRIDNGEWVEGDLIQSPDGRKGISTLDSIFTLQPSTVCQFTGLTDENGKKIWENDIIAYTDMTSTESGYSERDCIGQVKWSGEELCFYVTNRLSAESWEVLQECVVIGNAIDNPELLEVEHEWEKED